jgi:hypothetical protein
MGNNPTISTFIKRCSAFAPLVLSVAAFLAALRVANIELFQRFSFVVSDSISRSLGEGNAGHVVLIRLDQSFSKPQLERLFSHAIPILLTDYRATAVGIDIDFSEGGYSQLADDFASWTEKNPADAGRVVWAVGYENAGKSTAARDAENPFCEDCSGLSCKVRFVPKPVFGSDKDPTNYALALAVPDIDRVHRSSARFFCHTQTEKRLEAFHFRLVEIYCQDHPAVATCGELQQHKQARTNIYSWDDPEPLDLCQLVSCQEKDLGNKTDGLPNQINGKIVVLYSDVPSNDEHMTIMGERKGAEIVASLVENELQFGVAPHWRVQAVEWSIEGLFTVVMILLFHWRYTQSWAILIATAFFILYVYLVPRLAAWVPDFRNYVLAIILTFWIEVLLKAAWQSIFGESAKPVTVKAAEKPAAL